MGAYSYPAGGSARPHAVSSVAGTVNGVSNPSYTYDANGNLTAGAGRSVAYTAFNMAATITQGSTVASFAYDADHARMKMGVGSSTTYYAADLGGMAERIVAGASSTWHDYLNVDGKIVAMHASGTPGTSWRYIVSDHLGSAASVTDGSGAVVERDAYDPWGKRRNLNGSDDATCSLASLTTRGYTGHEHIDAQCLINMNARVYDLTIARFMTPDTFVSDPSNLQDWNAYTYVNNRPLTLTDPTGHFAQIALPVGLAAGTAVVVGVACYATGTCQQLMHYLSQKWDQWNDGSSGTTRTAPPPDPILAKPEILPPTIAVEPAKPRPITASAAEASPEDGAIPVRPAPQPNGGVGPQHGAPDHDQKIEDKANEARASGATNLRKNQTQVNARGEKLDSNRPDLQYDLDGEHHVHEWGRDDDRLKQQQDRSCANDPLCVSHTENIGPGQ